MFKWLRQNTTSLAPIEEKVSKDDFEFKTKNKEKIVMEDLIAENFVLLTKISHGSFGDIILSYSLRENIEVVVKKEKKEKNQRSSPLHNELKTYQNLLDISNSTDFTGAKSIPQLEIQGLPKFYGFGEKPEYAPHQRLHPYGGRTGPLQPHVQRKRRDGGRPDRLQGIRGQVLHRGERLQQGKGRRLDEGAPLRGCGP